MYNKVNSKDKERKQNNRTRPIYISFFIVTIILLSIAYAYLAISIDKISNGPKGVSPGHEEDPTTTTTVPVTQTPTPVTTSPVIRTTRPNEITTTTTKTSTTKKTTTETPPTPIEQPNWKIVFDNVKLNDGSVANSSSPIIDATKTSISYETVLAMPGEFYSFDADIVNKGSIDAQIYSIVNNGLTEEQKRYLDYTVKYKNGSEISKGDVLLAGQKRTVTVMLNFKDELTKADLPANDTLIKLTYQLVYVEK